MVKNNQASKKKTANNSGEKAIRGSKQSYAYDYIKDKIIKNIYKPRQLLSENELSKEMDGISRTPIREALRSLMHEDLIESIPGRGVMVSELRFEDILEIFEIRGPLHVAGIRMYVQRATDDDIELLSEIMRLHRESFNNGDYIMTIEYDHKFHLAIAEGTRNKRLYKLCQNYVDQIIRASYYTTHDQSRVQKSLEEHQQIFDAIKAREEDKAAKLEESHFAGISKYLAFVQINRHYM